MKSVGAMIKQLTGLQGTRDLTPWEERFIADLVSRTAGGRDTANLSANQVDKVEQIYARHFGDAA